MKYEKLYGEQEIDTWAISYYAPWGDKYAGKLLVTNKRLLFKPNSKNIIAPGRDGIVEFLKTNISGVEPVRNIFTNKIIVTTTDNSRHVFNYGVLNIDRIMAAINAFDADTNKFDDE